MAKRILRHLGLCLALVLACAALAGGFALAEGDPALEGLEVYLHDDSVSATDGADIYFESAYTSDGEEAEIEYSLRIEGVTDPGEAVNVSDVAADHRCFSVPASRLTAGHAYRAIVTASADGYAPAEDSGIFLVAAGRDGYAVQLEVNGQTEPVECLVNESMDICVRAAGAEEIWLGANDNSESPRGGCPPYEGERHFDQGWGEEGRRLVYARARFVDEHTGESFWVTSNAVPVTARAISDEKLPAPELTFDQAGTTVARGTPLEITIEEQPEDIEDLLLVLQIWRRDCFFDMVYWDPVDYVDAYDSIRLPTANLPDSTDGGAYELFATWSAPGYLSENYTAQFHVQDADPQPTISLLTARGGNTVAPHENFVISGFVPGADGVCLFEDWEIVEDHEGQQGIYSIRGIGELGERTYYLGALVDGVWRRLDDLDDCSVTVTVDTENRLPDLDEYVSMNYTDPESGEPVPVGSIISNDSAFTLQLDMLDPNEYDEDEVWYDFFFWNVSHEWNVIEERTSFRLHSDGEDAFTYDFSSGDLEPGCEYCVRVYAGLYKYPMAKYERRFLYVPERQQDQGETPRLTINGEDDLQEVDINEDVHVEVVAPGYGLQILWEDEWRIVDRDAYDGEKWSFDWSFGSDGEKPVVARYLLDYYDWWMDDNYYDEGFWDMYVSDTVYTNAVTVTVGSGGKTALPDVSLAQATLARGDDLVIRIPADHDEHLRYCDAGIFAENEWGDYWEWRDRNDVDLSDGVAAEIRISTTRLEPGRYRVQANFQGKQGYENCETGYHDPDLYFTVTEPQALSPDGALLTVTGAEVTRNQDGSYSVPTNARYTVSALLQRKDVDGLCLYENRDFVGEWYDEDSFTWDASRGGVETFVYTLGMSTRETDWIRLEDTTVTVHVTCGEGQQLADPEIEAPVSVSWGTPYTFAFKEVPNADVYYVNVSCDDYGDRPIFDRDILPYEPGDEGYGSGIHRITLNNPGDSGRQYTIRISALRHNWDQGYSEARYFCVSEYDVDPDELSLSLTQDGRAPSAQQPFLVNKDVDIEVQVGECSALEILWGGHWERVDLNECYDEEEGVARFTWRQGEPGRYGVAARIAYNDDPYDVYWRRFTEAVEVEFAADGTVHAPEVTLSPKTVTRGQKLIVNIGEMNSDEQAHTRSYWLRVSGVEDYNFWDQYYETELPPQSDSVTLSTAALPAGRYRMRLDMETDEGYAARGTDENDMGLWFTVTEPASPKAAIYGTLGGGDPQLYTGSKTMKPQTMQIYRVSAYVPGAERVCVFLNGERAYESDGESLYFDEWAPYSQTFTYTVGRWNREAEDFDVVSDLSLVVEVKNDDGALDPPSIVDVVDGVADYGDLTFKVTDVDSRAERLLAVVFREGSEEPVMQEYLFVEEGEDSYDFSVPGDRLAVGERCEIRVQTWAQGYDGSRDDRVLLISGPVSTDPEIVRLTVNGGNHAFPVGEEVDIRIETSDEAPQVIQLYWNDGWETFTEEDFGDDVDMSDITIGRSLDKADRKIVQARVCLDEVDWDDFDPNEINWHYSAQVELSPTANGDTIPLPTVSVTPEESDLGDTITITLSDMSGSTLKPRCKKVNVQVIREQDDDVLWDDEFETKDLGTGTNSKIFDIPAHNTGEEPLQPGTYRVHVHMSGKPGYESNWTDWEDEKRFTVRNRLYLEKWVDYDDQADEDIWQEAQSSSITLNTHDRYRVVALLPPNEPWCLFDGYDRIDDWDHGNHWHEDSRERGDETHTYYLGVRDRDSESGWRRLDDKSVTVHINSTENTLAAPEITDIPTSVSSDFNDFTFTFRTVENAGWYNINVHVRTGDDRWHEIYNADPEADPDENDPDWSDPEGITRNPDGTITVSIPRDAFEYKDEDGRSYAPEPGCEYYVNIAAHHGGWNSGRTERWVPVVGQTDEEHIRLSVEGQDENGEVTVDAGRRFNLHLEVGNSPDRVQLLSEDRWEDLNHDNLGEDFGWDFSNLDFEWDIPNRSCTMLARALWEDDEEGWVYSNPVNVTVVNHGLVGVPAISLSGLDENGRLARGDLLKLHFGPKPAHASEYHVRFRSVEDYNYNEEFFFRFIDLDEVDPNGFDLNLSTAMLPAYNNYRVEVFVRGGDGYQSNQTSEYDPALRFRVLSGALSGGFAFTIDKTEVSADGYYEVQTEEPFVLSGYIPGADSLVIDDDSPEDNSRYGDGESIEKEYRFDRAGEYVFTLGEYLPREDRYRFYDKAVIKVRVKSERNLAKAVISAPAQISEGEDLAFKVVLNDEAARYADVNVYDPDWEPCFELQGIDASTLAGEGRTFRIEELQLPEYYSEGGAYRIEVRVWTPGFNTSYSDQMVLLTPEAEEGAPTISVTVNGQNGRNDETGEPESVEVLTSTAYRIEFNIENTPVTPEGDPIAPNDIKIYWNNYWRSLEPGEDYDGDWFGGGWTEFAGGSSREIVIRARWWYDDSSVYVYSNVVPVEIVSDGAVAEPVLRIDDLEPGGEIARGTPLNVHVSLPNDQGVDDRDHVRALRFEVDETDEWGDGYWTAMELWANSDATEVTLPTYALEPGIYVINCFANAEPGWYSMWGEDFRFTVVPAEAAQPAITASKMQVTTGEQYMISGRIPNSYEAALFCGDDLIDVFDGSGFNHTDVRFDSGSYTYTLGVWSPSINDWRKLTGENASITVTVQADPKKGRLAPAVISGFDGTLVRGEDLEFDLEAVENAEDYYLEIHHSSDGRWDWAYDEDIWADQFDGEGKWHIRVPADRFEGHMLEEEEYEEFGVGSAFTIQVWAHANGYEQSETRIGFVTVPEPGEGAPAVGLELIDPQPAEGELPVAPVRSDVRFRMTTGLDAPQYAEVFWDNHWQSLWPDEFRGGSYASGEFSRETGDLNPQNVMVRVTPTDPGDLEEGEEIEEWYYSNSVSIGFEQSGEIGAVTGTLNPAMLRRGENLSVGIAVADVDGTDGRTGIRGFDVTVFGRDERGDFWDERQCLFFEGATKTAVIPTADLETGDYRVEIHAFGKAGYLDQQTDENDPALFFRVKPAIETMATFTATKTEVKTFERYALSAYVPGASRLELYENGDLWLHYDDEGEHRYWEGDRFTTETKFFCEEGQKQYTLKAYDDHGQPMATDWETIDVNIVSLGPLELPQIDFEGVPDAGKDFTYTVHPAEHIRNYFVEVSNAENEPIDSWEMTEGMTEPVTRIIPGTKIVSGGRYHIWIRVEGPRYNANEATRGFTPIDSSSGDKRLVLPDAITRIDDDAFMGNESLQVVDLRGAKNDVVIGSYAFADCPNLALVALSGSGVTFDETSFGPDVVFWCEAGSDTESDLRDMGVKNIITGSLPF